MMTKLVNAPQLVAILCFLVSAVPAFAQNSSTGPADEGGLDEVIVTGTRAAERTVFETLAPVDLLTDAAIESSISSDLTDVLAQLVPSYNVQRLPMADGQVFVRPATLRSLSPDQTLVLLNDKRFHRSALLGSRGAQGPDLSQIPTSAIGRVQVLRDGASAQYGSDAIAGVINIILDESTGFEALGLGELAEKHPSGCIDLLKLDIEGSEKELFEDPNCHRWLSRMKMIFVELHDRLKPGCTAAMEKAIAPYGFERMSRGSNLVLIRTGVDR